MSTETALVALIQRGRLALKKPDVTLKEVAEAIAEPPPDNSTRTETVPFPAVPAPVVLTEEVKDALNWLPSIFASVQPDSRRELTVEEVATLFAERDVLKKITGLISARDESIKEYIRTHLDVAAETSGVAVPKAVVKGGKVVVAATERDAAGHYILSSKGHPKRLPIPGTNQEFSSEYRAGALSIDGAALTAMEAAGDISREDYLAMTREVRVFDETKARAALLARPERLSILKAITSRTGAGSSLFVRKAR